MTFKQKLIGSLIAVGIVSGSFYLYANVSTFANRNLENLTVTGGILSTTGGGASQVDDAAFTPATSSVTMAGAEFDDTAPDSVDEGDGGAVRMSANRNMYVTIRDAAGNERGLNIDASGNITTSATTEYAEDAAHTTGESGTFVLGVRSDADGTFVDANGDYSPLSIDSAGFLRTKPRDNKDEDVAHSNADVGSFVLAVRNDDFGTSFTGGSGDYSPISVSPEGKVYTDDNVVEDAGHTTGDVGSLSMAVQQAADAALAGTDLDYAPLQVDANGALKVEIFDGGGSHTVDGTVTLGANSGVDIGDVDVTSVVPGTAATNLGKAEDESHSTGDTGVAVYGVRNDNMGTSFSGTNGDYTPISVDSSGRVIAAATGIEDANAGTGDFGTPMLAVRNDDAGTGLSGTNLDYTVPSVTANGELYIAGSGRAASIGKVEDFAHSSADVGVLSLAVRRDADTTLVDTTGDNAPLQVDANGYLKVEIFDGGGSHTIDGTVTLGANSGVDVGDVDVTSIVPGTAATNLGKAEDVAHADADTGVAVLGVRNDSRTARSGTDGDYTPVSTDSTGAVHVLPFTGLVEGGLTELVGINEAAIATGQFSDEVGVALGSTMSGEILEVCAYQTEDGTGAILSDLDFTMYIFDADPGITIADADITAAAAVTLMATLDFANGSFIFGGNAAMQCQTVALPFHALSTIYFAIESDGATSINSAAGDDEQVEFNFWVRRDS